MTQSNPLRRFARRLLRWCQRFSPPDLRDWGEAMLVELEFVEGNLAALAWAAGGAGVLMKRTFIQFVTGRSESAAAGREPAHKDSILGGGPMRKLTFGLALLALTVLAVLLFAPSFRQALAVTTHSWGMVAGREMLSEASLRRLAEQARAERDANTLAFVALALPPGSESSRIADEAVNLDSKLTWILAIRAAQHWPEEENPQSSAWIARVEAWDPSNAYPRFLAAQRAMMADGRWSVSWSEEKFKDDPRWREAMAEVFAATKWDSYFAARMDLDRDVMTRRHVNDPMLAVYAVSSHPILNVWFFQRYALFVLRADASKLPVGQAAPGGQKPSAEAWKVARFGQLMSLQGQNYFDRFTGAWLQREAYKRLAKIAEQTGDRDHQAMFAYQIESLDARRQSLPDNGFLIGVYQWNAAVGQVALAAMLMSGILLLGGIAKLILVRQEKPGAGRLAKAAHVSGFVGGAGLLASSVALYISYHPYADAFNRFAMSRGAAQADSLMSFWSFSIVTWRVVGLFPAGFGWIALLALAVCLLGIEVYRFFSSRAPMQETV